MSCILLNDDLIDQIGAKGCINHNALSPPLVRTFLPQAWGDLYSSPHAGLLIETICCEHIFGRRLDREMDSSMGCQRAAITPTQCNCGLSVIRGFPAVCDTIMMNRII